MLLINFHTGPSQNPLLLSLGISARTSFSARIICGVLFACLSGFAFYRLIRQVGVRALLAPLTLFSTQIMWFVLPNVLDLGYGWRQRKLSIAPAC